MKLLIRSVVVVAAVFVGVFALGGTQAMALPASDTGSTIKDIGQMYSGAGNLTGGTSATTAVAVQPTGF